MKDMARKGRSPKGDEHWSRRCPEKVARGEKVSKITESDVRTLLSMFHRGRRQTDLCRDFGLSAAQVSRIVSGKRWAHVFKEV